MSAKTSNLSNLLAGLFGVALLLGGLGMSAWGTWTSARDLWLRQDMAWAAPAKIIEPKCTTYNLVLTWCSAKVLTSAGETSVSHVHMLPPGFYDMFGNSPRVTKNGRANIGIVDPKSGYVTTATALDFAGARLFGALTPWALLAFLIFAGSRKASRSDDRVRASTVAS